MSQNRAIGLRFAGAIDTNRTQPTVAGRLDDAGTRRSREHQVIHAPHR
jgi:hypothetical protein